MSSASLLKLNVDTIFEEHNVAEIGQLQQKILTAVESKRQELRSMVGERYRDLLKAADTIASMKGSSGTIIQQIELIHRNCQDLNEQQLIGFKTFQDDFHNLRTPTEQKQQNNYFSVMTQIKLLTSLAELIWLNIDRELFLKATQYFILSMHISTGLQLDASNPLVLSLPVAKKQWEISKPFHATIKQSVVKVMEREELQAVGAAECLLSLMLLDKKNLNGLLKLYLQLRSTAYAKVLAEEEAALLSERRRIRDKILMSLRILHETMQQLGQLFLEQNALILKRLSIEENITSLALEECGSFQFSTKLPDIISKFHVKYNTEPLNREEAKSSVLHWLEEVHKIAAQELQKLLALVNSINAIKDIKDEAIKLQKLYDASSLSQVLALTPEANDFYGKYYQRLINERVKHLIKTELTNVLNFTYDTLLSALDKNKGSTASLWALERGKCTKAQGGEGNGRHRHINKLQILISGYDEEIIALCQKMDRRLGLILQEVQALLAVEEDPEQKEVFDLTDFVKGAAEGLLLDLLSKLKSLQLQNNNLDRYIYVLRASASLMELTPNLRKCFQQEAQGDLKVTYKSTSINEREKWQRICLVYEEEIFKMWQKVMEGILEQHKQQRSTDTDIHNIILEDLANWETLTMEHKDDTNSDSLTSTPTSSHSNIYIPCQPSISLQSQLFSLIDTLNQIIPQTLPDKVSTYLCNALLESVLARYESLLLQMAAATFNQKICLQFYFDLLFLQLMFDVTRKTSAELYLKFEELKTKLRTAIDPFDFEIFIEQVNQKVKDSVMKLNQLLGVLLPKQMLKNLDIASTLATATTIITQTALSNDKDPNVLNLSSSTNNSLWFPLLPIVESSYEAIPKEAKDEQNPSTRESKEKTSTDADRRKPSTTNASTSGPTKSKSFFGSMSQDWFR